MQASPLTQGRSKEPPDPDAPTRHAVRAHKIVNPQVADNHDIFGLKFEDLSSDALPAAPTPQHTPPPGTEGPGSDEEEEEHRWKADDDRHLLRFQEAVTKWSAASPTDKARLHQERQQASSTSPPPFTLVRYTAAAHHTRRDDVPPAHGMHRATPVGRDARRRLRCQPCNASPSPQTHREGARHVSDGDDDDEEEPPAPHRSSSSKPPPAVAQPRGAAARNSAQGGGADVDPAIASALAAIQAEVKSIAKEMRGTITLAHAVTSQAAQQKQQGGQEGGGGESVSDLLVHVGELVKSSEKVVVHDLSAIVTGLKQDLGAAREEVSDMKGLIRNNLMRTEQEVGSNRAGSVV